MEAKQAQVLKRVTKKLSALRVTLRKDERDILDQLILGAKAEVGGHRLASAKASRAASSRVAAAKAAEVDAHAMSNAMSARASSAKAAEVGAHAMSNAISTRVAAKQATAALRKAINLDAAGATYIVTE